MKKQPSIALGTWSWGKGMAGGDQVFGNNVGVDELRPVFDEAMKNGLNLWDSAVVYGMGDSETILSAFTKGCRREDVLISTKFTPQIADGTAADPVAAMCESSLSRFGTDYIDMYWIHNPADVERWTPYLIQLVKSGKVRRVGVSNHNLSQIKRAEEILSAEGVHVSAVQNHYSLLYRSSEKAGILDYCPLLPAEEVPGSGLLQGERHRFLGIHGVGAGSIERQIRHAASASGRQPARRNLQSDAASDRDVGNRHARHRREVRRIARTGSFGMGHCQRHDPDYRSDESVASAGCGEGDAYFPYRRGNQSNGDSSGRNRS